MWSDPVRQSEEQEKRRTTAARLEALLGADAAIYVSPRDGFTELATTYDQRMGDNPLYLLETTETLAALPSLSGLKVADLACGTGRYALQMARMDAQSVVGVDFVPEMLTVARRKARRAELSEIEWQVGDLLEHLPFEDDSLDVAVCALTLSFISDPIPALQEIVRVLKPEGTLVVSDYHPHGLAAARAKSFAVGGKDKSPYLRFTSADGDECRIAQTIHNVSQLYKAAGSAGLRLNHLAEPSVDRRLATTYPSLRESVGLPLALILRFTKE